MKLFFLSLLLSVGCVALQITTVSLPPATHGVPYLATIQADIAPALWFLYQYQGLPQGLGMNADSGVISGTPTTPGTYAITVFALDPSTCGGNLSPCVGGVQSAPQRFMLVVQ